MDEYDPYRISKINEIQVNLFLNRALQPMTEQQGIEYEQKYQRTKLL